MINCKQWVSTEEPYFYSANWLKVTYAILGAFFHFEPYLWYSACCNFGTSLIIWTKVFANRIFSLAFCPWKTKVHQQMPSLCFMIHKTSNPFYFLSVSGDKAASRWRDEEQKRSQNERRRKRSKTNSSKNKPSGPSQSSNDVGSEEVWESASETSDPEAREKNRENQNKRNSEYRSSQKEGRQQYSGFSR